MAGSIDLRASDTNSKADPGSFRDPLSRVLLDEGRVFRLFSELGDLDLQASWSFIQSQADAGAVVQSDLLASGERFPEAAATVEHPLLPLISYPFEWSFGMLKDAALLHLKLVREAAEAGIGLKDASSYNVQFQGSKPIFIDVGSFQPRKPTDPWFGYQQFCELFLYPLMIQAYTGVSFQPLLRGSINGVTVAQARGILGPIRPKLQRGRFTHVLLHSFAQGRMADSDDDVVADVADAGMKTEILLATVNKIIDLVEKLDLGMDDSLWSDYSERQHYPDTGLQEKRSFVAESLDRAVTAIGATSLDHVWDVGCNDGMFSVLAAERAKTVLAMDADELVVERLYQGLKTSEFSDRITPLVVDLSTAGGGIGWRGSERPGLYQRSSPDAVLYLAVIHHLALTFNIPIREQIEMLSRTTKHLIIEFPNADDPMVQKLLRNKRPGIHDDYNRENFERLLKEEFAIEAQMELQGGTRTIYHARS